VLIVPGGHATEIIHGWDRDALVHAAPWAPPGRPRGIGAAGVEAIRAFVRTGGGFVGLGSGGGVLAVKHARLIDAVLVTEGIGEGIATLRVVAPNHPVAWGMPNIFPAYYYSEPTWCIWGAPVFAARGAAQTIAAYEQPSTWRTQDKKSLKKEWPRIAGTAAILAQQVGAGRAVVMSISPNFRATWVSTTPLLANAIWHTGRLGGGQR
jgi:hypothetical protein